MISKLLGEQLHAVVAQLSMQQGISDFCKHSLFTKLAFSSPPSPSPSPPLPPCFPPPESLSGDYPGYDWFISSLFLVCGGSLEETIQLATEFSTLLHSGYMWLARLHLSVSQEYMCLKVFTYI